MNIFCRNLFRHQQKGWTVTTKWNRQKARELLVIFCGLAAYCVIAMVTGMPCLIKGITGISCPGCGMTRSFLALMRLDFAGAWHYHPLVFYLLIAVPVMIVLYLRDKDKQCKGLLLVSAGLMLGVYLYRVFVMHSPILEFAPENGLLLQLLLHIAGLFP